MINRLTPPDFGTFFGTENPNPIEFECRAGANLFHDLIFLSSYLHDAVFDPRKIQLDNMVLRIPMRRDRWELYSGGELESIDTELTVSPVLSIKWQQKSRRVLKSSVAKLRNFPLRYTYPAESFWDCCDHGELVLSSHGDIKLRVEIGGSATIRFRDLANDGK